MHDQNAFLGSGWSFPPNFHRHNGDISLVEHEEDINQSLLILLSTTPGERLMHPSFGCNLKHMVFETVTVGVITKIKDAIARAILFFEPRITLQNVEVNTEDNPDQPNSIYDGVMEIHIEYIIRKTNTRSNMVFPFYFAEADAI